MLSEHLDNHLGAIRMRCPGYLQKSRASQTETNFFYKISVLVPALLAICQKLPMENVPPLQLGFGTLIRNRPVAKLEERPT